MLAAIGGAYLVWRFDVVTLPGSCSPILMVPAGSRLVVDTRPSVCEEGDLVFHGPAEGPYEFARVVAREGAAVLVATDSDECVGPRGRGPHAIAVASVTARVVFVLGP